MADQWFAGQQSGPTCGWTRRSNVVGFASLKQALPVFAIFMPHGFKYMK